VFGEQAARIADPGSDLGRILELGQNQGKETAFAVTRSLDAGESSRSLTLLLSRPTELIAQEADPMRREGLATMGILLLGAVFLALLTVRHLTASLRQVASAAHAIAHGNYQTPLPAVAGGEVGLLVSAFRRMAAEVSIRESSLEELNRNLERRVDERTSDLKRSRAELVRQQVLQRLVLEGISEGVVVADTRGRFLLWNRKASAIIGSRPDDIDPSRWSEHFGVYHTEDGELVPSEQLPLTRAIHGESTNDVEVFVRKGKSDGRWISVVGRPLRDQNGQLEGGVVTLRDITERKRLQSRLEDHQRELARVGRLALIGEIAAMASHQLSQPVAAISNYAGAALQLQRNNRLEEARLAEILGHINRLAERAGRALDNLRSLARRREVSPTGVDFSAVARSCVEVVADRLTRDGIQVTCDLAEHLPTLRGDPMELEQLLLHLVFNALDALEHLPHERRRMWIRTKWESEPERVLVEVGDSGNGISPAIQDRLFEPWVTDKPDGLGVGLSIVRTLAENYGGRVWMAPADPSGSVFSVEFPVGEGTT